MILVLAPYVLWWFIMKTAKQKKGKKNMLQIQHIRKEYKTGKLVQKALDDVSLNLRDNEFVAILGPSGSGKTTLLNIIGGLDRYDSGDLIINGISTKKYKDRDWDSYRNHTIGFVFQSYNLIPHQTLLANVELALTISGVGKAERRRRAKEALEKVGLGEQIEKRPSQLSGGQMQRVAIARALVNDPEILLADEPTGALDSNTSVQVMDLLREVAKDRLVVMVTHNPELAELYATRIVNLRDGKIRSDTNPYEVDEAALSPPEHKNMGKSSMSFLTALALSFNNLKTKKARTLLTSFAGSIGIIGIADHEHGSAVGGDNGASLDSDAGPVILHLEGGVVSLSEGLGGIQSLQGVLAVIVHLVGDNIILRHALLGEVILVGGDDLGGAVGEQQLNAVAQIPVGTALDVQDQSVIADFFLLLDIDHVAIGVDIDGVVLLDGNVSEVLAANLGSSLITGAVNGQSLVISVVGDLVLSNGDGAFHLLGSLDRLDLLGGQRIGVQNIIVISELVIGLELVVEALHGDGALSGHNHIGVLLVGSLDSLVDGADVGVDLSDGDGVGIVIIEDLGQNAVAGVADLGVVTLFDGNGVGLLHAILIHGNVLGLNLGTQAQILVDVAVLDLLGVGSVGGVGVSTNFLSLQLPHVSGTSEVIGTSLDGQVVEVLLSELHDAVLVEDLTIGVAVVDHLLGLGASDDNSGAVGGNGGLGIILDHVSGHGVQSVQASLLTGDSLNAVEVAHQIIVQADVQSALGNVDGPVSAGVLLDLGVIAQGAQQHLHEGIAGQGVGGTESTVGITGDDALLLAVSDVASEGVVGRNVLVRSGVSNQSGCGGGAKDQVADDLGGSATGQGGAGTEVTFGIAVDDLRGGHHVNSFFVGDGAVIGEVLGTGADSDQRHGHHQSQYQRKELLHGVSSF